MGVSSARIFRYVRRHGFGALPHAVVSKLWRKLFANRHLVFCLPAESLEPSQHVQGLKILRCTGDRDIPEHFRRQLVDEEGVDFPSQLEQEFLGGGVFWLGCIDQSVVAYQWSRKGSYVKHWFVSLNPEDIVIFATVTFPEWRGRSIGPAMMQFIIAHELEGQGVAYVDCKVWNKSAIRGIEKAGFQKVGEPMRPVTVD